MLMAGEQMTGISSSCVTVVKDWFVISFSEGDVGQWSGVGNLPFLWVVAIGASCGIPEGVLRHWQRHSSVVHDAQTRIALVTLSARTPRNV